MSFLDNIFAGLERAGDTPVLQEIRDGRITAVGGRELLELAARARAFLASRGLKKGDRCALYANNGIRWVAMDLAVMSEGLIVVPLYARQAPAELVAMMKDCSPGLICCGDSALRDGIVGQWAEAPARRCSTIFLRRRQDPRGSHNWPIAIRSRSSIRREPRAKRRAWC